MGPPHGNGGLPLAPPQTHSLECTSPECTLGYGGARYKTPAYPLKYAMQMLVMHREDNHHQQLRPAQVGQSNGQNHKAENISFPNVCSTGAWRDLQVLPSQDSGLGKCVQVVSDVYGS